MAEPKHCQSSCPAPLFLKSPASRANPLSRTDPPGNHPSELVSTDMKANDRILAPRSDACSIGGKTASTVSTVSMASMSSRCSMSSSCSLSSQRSSVRFGDVSIHTHQVTLGDNPSVKNGPPISLEWKPVKSERFNLDEYEAMSKGRKKKATRIPEHLREEWLRESGHSKTSLRKTSKEVDTIRATRCISKLELNPMQEYQVLSNVSLRQPRRSSADSETQKSKKIKGRGLSRSISSRDPSSRHSRRQIPEPEAQKTARKQVGRSLSFYERLTRKKTASPI